MLIETPYVQIREIIIQLQIIFTIYIVAIQWANNLSSKAMYTYFFISYSLPNLNIAKSPNVKYYNISFFMCSICLLHEKQMFVNS